MFLVDGGKECGRGKKLAQYEGEIFKSDKKSNQRENLTDNQNDKQ